MSELDKKKLEIINKEIESIVDYTTEAFCGEDADNVEKIDTLPFRQAIEKYVERLLGIYHEDYNYSIINKLLDDDLKKYIKGLLFNSKKLSKKDINELELPFSPKEFLQILIFVANIKHKVCLTYIAHAYNSYNTELD